MTTEIATPKRTWSTKPKPERDARLYAYWLEKGKTEERRTGMTITAIAGVFHVKKQFAQRVIRREQKRQIV